MSRRHRAVKRPVLPDAKFKDAVVSKFMSCLMFDGKRSVAFVRASRFVMKKVRC